MLTESKLILPILDNDGLSLSKERLQIEDMILRDFGGFNRAASSGAWRDPVSGRVYSDDCLTYTIAGDWSGVVQRRTLEGIARYAARIMRQECIYLSLSGDVQFVAPEPAVIAAE